MSTLDAFFDFFEHIPLSPDGWPVAVSAALACESTLEQWPAFPPAATLAHHRLGHGRGITAIQAQRGAVGELIEIASCSVWGDEEFTRASFADLGPTAWPPDTLNGFSAEQITNRPRWNSRLEGLDWVPPSKAADGALDWVSATLCDSGKEIWVPADAVFIGRREKGEATACAVADTNGCATATSHDDALIHAIFELIERDATGLWWYGQRNAPILDATDLEIAGDIDDQLAERGRTWRVLDITNDINIPTVAAIACGPQGQNMVCGFATRALFSEAIVSAVTEMMQMEIKLLIQPENSGELGPETTNSLEPHMQGTVAAKSQRSSERQSIAGDLQSCLDLLADRSIRLATLDMTRDAFGLPVVRALSPDLCHWKPRFGRARLGGLNQGGTGPDQPRKHALSPQLFRG